MNNKKVVIIVITLILASICLLCFITSISAYFFARELRIQSISNFEECVNSGYPVMDSYPRQCAVPGGRTFIEEFTYPDYPEVSSVPPTGNVIIYSPLEQSIVSSPIYIEGEVVSDWYWEGIFNIELRNEAGDVIGSTYASAEESWMQEGYVRFTATMAYETDEKRGNLVFMKANPSGLPENDEEYSILVLLAQPTTNNGCVVTGCSGQICSDEEVATTCEYLDHYVCYKNAICERQDNGLCGWTPTQELGTCIGTNTGGLQY